MIKIDEQFTISKDPCNWILTETKTHIVEKGKYAGEEKEMQRDSYYSNIDQIANEIINRSSANAESMNELKEFYKNAVKALSKHIKMLNDSNESQDKESDTDDSESTLNDSEEVEKPKRKIRKKRIKKNAGFSTFEMLVLVSLPFIVWVVSLWTDKNLEFVLSYFKNEPVEIPMWISVITTIVLNGIIVAGNILAEIFKYYAA